MQAKKPKASEKAASGTRSGILVVGEIGRWHMPGQHLPKPDNVKFLDFQDLTPGLLRSVNPEFVLSPLLCRSFDCVDLAAILDRAGYGGSYRVICEDLPDTSLVRGEILGRFPGLDFDVVNVIVKDARRLN